jgi:hypothetical protein
MLSDEMLISLADLQARAGFDLIATEASDRVLQELIVEISEEVDSLFGKAHALYANSEHIRSYNRVRDIQKLLHLIHLEKAAGSLAGKISSILGDGSPAGERELAVFIGAHITALKSDKNLLDGFIYFIPSFYGLQADGVRTLIDDNLRPKAHAIFLELMDREELSLVDVKEHYRRYVSISITEPVIEQAPILPHLKLIVDKDTMYVERVNYLRQKQSITFEEHKNNLLQEEARHKAFDGQHFKGIFVVFLVVFLFVAGWLLWVGVIGLWTIFVPIIAGVRVGEFLAKFLENK